MDKTANIKLSVDQDPSIPNAPPLLERINIQLFEKVFDPINPDPNVFEIHPVGGEFQTSKEDLSHTYFKLATGSYFLQVRGRIPSGGEQSFRYVVTGETVPIPAAIWMFLTALGGLGGLGFQKYKRQAGQ